jgi:uncharacterized protein
MTRKIKNNDSSLGAGLRPHPQLTACPSRVLRGTPQGRRSVSFFPFHDKIYRNPMKTELPWEIGQVILLRGVWHGVIHWACPARIVQDTPELVAVYWVAGTPTMLPRQRTIPQDFLTNNIRLYPSQWKGTDVLMLVTPGASHSVELMWEAGTNRMRHWYINLQEPLRRTRQGFNSMDHMLDIVISPDQSTWQWKDEDEFNEAVAIGVYSKEEALDIRKEGEKVIADLLAGKSPFCDGWENWRPPARWEIPPLSQGWDDLRE